LRGFNDTAGAVVSQKEKRKSSNLSDINRPDCLESRKAFLSLARKRENRPDAAELATRPKLELVKDSGPSYAFRNTPRPLCSGWRALSVFSGCGGFDLGFLQEGVFSQQAIDIDRVALETYSHNLSEVARIADLASFVPSAAASDVLLAGAPCQGFSTAGKRLLDDPRNALLMRVADIAIANRTKVLVVENVPAALSGKHRHLWIALEDRLRAAGYNVRRILLEGDKSGLAQRRKRLFLICWKGSDCINLGLESKDSISLRHALASLSLANDKELVWPDPNGKDAKIIKHIKPGQKLSNVRLSARSVSTWEIPEVFGLVSNPERDVLIAVARLRRRDRVRSYGDGDPVSIDRINQFLGRMAKRDTRRLVQRGFLREIDGEFELSHTYNGRYRRLSWEDVSPTVDTRFGRVDLFVHPEDDRGFTAREAARIQGFPDNFVFLGKPKEVFTQIGNAVPPPMAAALAKLVREAILKA